MGWGEISLHYNEVPPASRGGSAGDSADVSEDRLNLFPSTTCDLRLNSLNGGVIPLPSPPPCHKGGLVGYGEKTLEVAAQLLHWSRGEAADGHSEVQAARSPCTRSTGAVAEHVGLVPVPTTDGTGTYLWIGRVGGDRPVFAMPAEVPEAAKGPYPLTERVRAVKPGCRPDRLLGTEPNRRSAACLTEVVPVIPISPNPMVDKCILK